MAITYKEEFNLNDLSFEDVIDGLNKYFAEDETRVRVPQSYVEIKSSNKVLQMHGFYRFNAAMYLDKLIAWLRTEHGVFYYPGMEAKYAKTEQIPPLTKRLRDEGALNSLKKLHKRVTGKDPEVDSHTLIADGIAHQVSVYEAEVEELKEKCNFLQDEFGKGKVIQEFIDRRKKTNAKLDAIKKSLEDILKVIDDVT